MKFKIFLLFCLFPVFCKAGELPLKILTVKAYALYWPGQTIKDEERKADRLDYYELKKMEEQNSSAVLTDGDFSWNSSWKTYFWSQQPKRLEIIADLGGMYHLEHLEIWQGGTQQKGNLIEKITVWGAKDLAHDDPWDSSQSQEQQELQAPIRQNAYPIRFQIDASYRYLKIVCSSQLSAMMVLSEIKAFGRREAVSSAEIPLPETAFRFELENLPGTFSLSRPGLSGEKGCFITTEHKLMLQLPAEVKLPMYSFLRYLDSGEKTIEWEINGQMLEMPATGNRWCWVAGPVVDRHDLQLVWRRTGKESGLLDSMILGSDPDLFNNQEPALWQLKQIPELAPPLSFAEKLLQERPEIDAAEFGRKVAQHYGYPATTPRRVIDDNNNILFQGKPFFQLGFYHVQPDGRLQHTPVNTYIANQTDGHSHAVVISHLSALRAYDVIAQRLKTIDHSRIVMHYLVDEPDGYIGITLRDIELLNGLIKAICPGNATFLNFAANSTMHKAFTITDVIGLDHYPIPYGRIADIGYTMDAMRYFSGNRPVVFVPQAFSWEGYGRKDGRWPTPDELSAMTLMGLVHGAKGLLFYEFPAPKMDSKTSIQDINPQLWARLEKLLEAVDRIIPGLLGPELISPWQQPGMEEKQQPEFRLLVNEQRSEAWLLAVNPWDNSTVCTLEVNEEVLPLLSLQGLENHGVAVKHHGNLLEWTFSPFATAIFRVESTTLQKLAAVSQEQLLKELAKKFTGQQRQQVATVKIQAGGTLDWQAATDLLDSWKSINRPDRVRIAANSQGVHVQSTLRFPVGHCSIFHKRDDEVWRDPGIELFLGVQGQNKYVHLMVNTLNVQADWKFDHSLARPVDKNVDFSWQSRVDSSGELVTFDVFILWEELQKMLQQSEIRSFAFNVSSTSLLLDWAGLSGSGFHAPASFGVINLE